MRLRIYMFFAKYLSFAQFCERSFEVGRLAVSVSSKYCIFCFRLFFYKFIVNCV